MIHKTQERGVGKESCSGDEPFRPEVERERSPTKLMKGVALPSLCLGPLGVSYKRVKAKSRQSGRILSTTVVFKKERKKGGAYKGGQRFEKDCLVTEVAAGQRAAILLPEAVSLKNTAGNNRVELQSHKG